jgi:hypothetical protein
VAAQNVVVIVELPKWKARFPAMFKCALLFESVHKTGQLALRGRAFNKKMQVVRHEAIRVHRKFPACCFRRQNLEKARHRLSIAEQRLPAMAADRYEVSSLAEIVLRRETDIFSRESHRLVPERGCYKEPNATGTGMPP